MNHELVAELEAAQCFKPFLAFEALASVHVPFDELRREARYETRLLTQARRSGKVAIIGSSGSGKSSVSSWALDPWQGTYPLPVPVAVHRRTDLTADDVAGLVLRAVAIRLREVSPLEAEDAERASQKLKPGKSHVWSTRLNFGVLQQELREQLQPQRPWHLDERRDAMLQMVEVFRSQGVEPILVLDDTDKWLDRRGRPEPVVRSFFRDVVRWLVELPGGLVAHVHARYVDDLSDALDWFDEQVVLPQLDAAGIRAVLDRRVLVASTGDASADDVFTSSAIDMLTAWHQDRGRQSIRSVVHLASMALVEACIAGKDRIDGGAMANALADLT